MPAVVPEAVAAGGHADPAGLVDELAGPAVAAVAAAAAVVVAAAAAAAATVVAAAAAAAAAAVADVGVVVAAVAVQAKLGTGGRPVVDTAAPVAAAVGAAVEAAATLVAVVVVSSPASWSAVTAESSRSVRVIARNLPRKTTMHLSSFRLCPECLFPVS